MGKYVFNSIFFPTNYYEYNNEKVSQIKLQFNIIFFLAIQFSNIKKKISFAQKFRNLVKKRKKKKHWMIVHFASK